MNRGSPNAESRSDARSRQHADNRQTQRNGTVYNNSAHRNNSQSRPDPRMNGQNRRRPGQSSPGQSSPGQNRPGQNGNSQRSYISPEEKARREAYARKRRAEEERRKRAQMAEEERLRKMRKAQRRREFKEGMAVFGGRLLIFAVMLTVMVALCMGVFLISLTSAPDKPSTAGKVTYYFGGSEIRQEKTKDAVSGDTVYFCFNDLAEYLNMSESGSAGAMKFIMPDSPSQTAAGNGNEDSIVFLTDETKVILNGQLVIMKVPNRLVGSEIWVSSEFVEDFMDNISLTYDEKKREMRIARVKDEINSTENETKYLTPVFTLKRADIIDPIPEDPLIGDLEISFDGNSSEVLTFKTDLSAYEVYMNPEGDMRDAFLILVNDENPLDEEYYPTGMYEVANISVITSTQYLAEYAAKALEAMFREMKANEFYSMAVYSGFRSYYDQSGLFENKVAALQASASSLTRTQAEKNASFTVSRPGCDDHQTGLGVDMDTFGCVELNFQFEPEYKWLSENAWKFGFILRYPRDKTSETNHAFEPWHYRYVGRYHAQRIYMSGMCLEEYLDYIS